MSNSRGFTTLDRLLVVILFLNLCAFFTACGGSSSGPGGDTTTTPMATPAITPSTSTLTSSSATVTLADATAGASIYYTTDGSMPTTASTKYNSAFQLNCPVNTVVTVKAYAPALNSSYTDSSVASATYTCPVQIQTQPMATPAITPSTSTLTSSSATVTLADATAGASIYYTTDGSMPTTASTKYTAPFAVNVPSGTANTVTVKAFSPALNSSYTDSTVASATYTFQVQVVTPVISPVAGNIAAGTAITISDVTSGATIYYTIDGSTPSVASVKYVGPFTVSTSETIKALAVGPGASYTNSAIASATYTVVQNPTIQAGTLATAVLLNTSSVELPVTTTNCSSMTYTISPAFPTPTNLGGVTGSITYTPANACTPIFHPGSTMPAMTGSAYQYAITFTAIGATGTTPVSATTTVTLTDPPIVMDTNPVTPATLPAGNGNATQTFNGSNCGFTSSNGLTSTNAWSGTLAGGTTPDSAKNGIPTVFVDCNHVTMGISYSGFVAGDQVWDYLYNPPPGGGISPKIIINVVATTNSSAVSVSADGTTATLKSQSVVNYLDAEGNIAKTVTSAPGEIHFGSNVVPAGDIHQLVTCGAASANFCGLGKNQLTVFTSNGVATKSYSIPEDAKFAVANNDSGIYVFATNGHLYNLAANGTVSLLDGFASEKEVTAAAINGNELAALTSNGQLQRFDVSTGASIGTYTVPTEMNNIAYTRDGSVILGKLGSATLTVLDRSGAVHTLVLTVPLKTIVQAEQSDPLISMETGDVIRMDSFGDSTLMATAPKPEDLNAGFRIAGRTLVLTHVDPTTNARQVQTLATQQ